MRELLASAEFMHLASPPLSLQHRDCLLHFDKHNEFIIIAMHKQRWSSSIITACLETTHAVTGSRRSVRYASMQVGVGLTFCWVRIKNVLREDEMNHLCFSIPSGSRSSLPHTVFYMKTVKEHLALDLEHHSVSIQLPGSGMSTLIFEENAV